MALSIGTVALGGALTALAAYATSHQAEQPALYIAVGLLARELSKYADRRDPTRSLAGASALAASPSTAAPASTNPTSVELPR